MVVRHIWRTTTELGVTQAEPGIVGNLVYADGTFSTARPASVTLGGPGTVASSKPLANNPTADALSSSFAHAGQSLVSVIVPVAVTVADR
jgi:hypothetical protein